MISEESLATSQPDPMQKPTLALLSAGASLIPSAVTATQPPISYSPTMRANLSSGVALASTLSFIDIYLKVP